MTVFRGDSGNGEAIEPGEDRETSGSAQVNVMSGAGASAGGASGAGASGAGASGAGAPAGGAPAGGAPGTTAPTASAMRRALARVRDGKPIDASEATIL